VPTGEGRRTEQRELDAVAIDHSTTVLAVGSCKWTSTPVGLEQESLLVRLSAHVPGADSVRRHYFYSRAGFTETLRRLGGADPERYRLVGPGDLYG
jgi:hypothetical protein